MPQTIAGTFAGSAGANTAGFLSDTLVIPSGVTTAILSISGNIDTSNRVRTRKSLDNGHTWVQVVSYTSAQTATAVPVVHGEHWQLLCSPSEFGKTIQYSLSAES